jgi:hypothetical protein
MESCEYGPRGLPQSRVPPPLSNLIITRKHCTRVAVTNTLAYIICLKHFTTVINTLGTVVELY